MAKNRIVTIQLLVPGDEEDGLTEDQLLEGLCAVLCEDEPVFRYQPAGEAEQVFSLVIEDVRITQFPPVIDNPQDLALDELVPRSSLPLARIGEG